MPRNIRAAWIVVGTALTVFVVIAVALAVWSGIRVPRHYDFAFPGSFDASLISQESTETTVTTYGITTPVVIVDATGRVGVRVVADGEPGRLSVRRELTWTERGREFAEEWQDGKLLRITFRCPGEDDSGNRTCRADYTVTVPSDVQVMMATSRGARRCPTSATDTICRTPSSRP